MKKLPHVLLAMTVLSLGIMNGYYNWSLDMGRISGEVGFFKHMSDTFGVAIDKFTKSESDKNMSDNTPRKYEDSGDVKAESQVIELRKDPVPVVKKDESLDAGVIVDKDEPSGAEEVAGSEKAGKFDKVDSLIKEAEIYSRIATLNIELREEYMRKAFNTTTKALNIIDPMYEKDSDNEDINERLQRIYKIRNIAVKGDSAR